MFENLKILAQQFEQTLAALPEGVAGIAKTFLAQMQQSIAQLEAYSIELHTQQQLVNTGFAQLEQAKSLISTNTAHVLAKLQQGIVAIRNNFN
jgi:hypothetical protein